MYHSCKNHLQARQRVTRRRLLQVGGLGLVGALAPQFSEASSPGRQQPRARSVIFLHQFGGPSHVDTFDMKPTAPAEIRGHQHT